MTRILLPADLGIHDLPEPVLAYDEADLPSPADVGDIEFFVPIYMGPEQTLALAAEMPRLQVVQALTSGVDNMLGLVRPGVTLCRAGHVHDASTAELAVALVLAKLRGLDVFARQMHTGQFLHERREALYAQRVLIVGAGEIGRAIAERLKPFEAAISLVGRAARDGVHGIEELPDLVGRHDVVILCLPLTDQTRGLVDADLLSRMRPGALLVNVSRGPVVVTDDLLDAVRSGRVTAALDVTDPEPLPPDHPLWQESGVLISPHVGGNTSAFIPRARSMVRQQIERWLSGEPLRYVVPGGYVVPGPESA